MTLSDFLAPALAFLSVPVARQAPVPPSVGADPSRPGAVAVLAEGVELFLAPPPSSDFDRFGLLALACRSAEARDRTALDEIKTAEAMKRPGARPQGLEWACGELEASTDRLRQSGNLLGQLAAHEPIARAILAASPEQLAAVREALSIGDA